MKMGKRTEMGIVGDASMFSSGIRRAQKAAKCKDWSNFKQVFVDDKKELFEDFDLYKSSAISVAAIYWPDDPGHLRELLEMLSEEEMWGELTRKNYQGNTLLHEIAMHSKKEEMVDLVLEFEKKAVRPSEEDDDDEEKRRPLLERKNNDRETPLFRAAKFGNLKMLKHMAKCAEAQPQSDMRIHLQSKSGNILHASVLRQSFDVALWIIKRPDWWSIVQVLEADKKNGLTCLQLLARMPRVLRSHYFNSKGPLANLIYYLLPENMDETEGDDFRPTGDLETGQQHDAKPPTSGLSKINYNVWKCLAKVFKGPINSVWDEKKKHLSAYPVAEFLVENDFSWQNSMNRVEKALAILPSVLHNVPKLKKRVERQRERQDEKDSKDKTEDEKESENYTPLLVAVSNGIIEIVELFLKVHPNSILYVNEKEENILHVAVRHRQLEIFNLLHKQPEFDGLAARISSDNRTALHQAATMDYYRGSRSAGAAYQLQQELQWYKRVEDAVPPHLHFHCDKEKITAGDVLDIEHDDMLEDAQEWIKKTVESCSTVAVLVATVVFAAAYTIPGGTERGEPVLLSSPVFIFFTAMDIVALAFSLASVVMFLSILTSPFELWDFHKSLPLKLTTGFSFLFGSLITTMLAFSATILLTIRLQWKNWTSTLVYSAAFFPVTIFGLIEFPLYTQLTSLLSEMLPKIYEKIKKPFVRKD